MTESDNAGRMCQDMRIWAIVINTCEPDYMDSWDIVLDLFLSDIPDKTGK